MSNYLTIKEVAARMKVSIRTVQRWQDEGIISFFKQGKVVRISEDNFQGWLDKRTVKSKKQIA